MSVVLPVPLNFAYRWCTDYTAEDGKYAGEDRTIHLQRKILARNRRRVVFENLYDVGDGWGWERHHVTLRPPNRWHSEGKGNQYETRLDYALTPVTVQQTCFDMTWRSRPIARKAGRRTPAKVVEAYVTQLWVLRARAMEREFREKRHRPRPT